MTGVIELRAFLVAASLLRSADTGVVNKTDSKGRQDKNRFCLRSRSPSRPIPVAQDLARSSKYINWPINCGMCFDEH